jgi:hypothetical protein
MKWSRVVYVPDIHVRTALSRLPRRRIFDVVLHCAMESFPIGGRGSYICTMADEQLRRCRVFPLS